MMSITVSKLEKSKVEIIGSIPADYFNFFRKQALQNINDEISLDGFRKGKVPENILISKVGEMSILEEMAELALSKAYPEIIANEKIDAIGKPEIHITKIASGNPLEFKIITAVIPKMNLGDYKKATKEIMLKPEEKFEVTNKEVEDAIERIKKSHTDHAGHDHESPESKEEIKKILLENKKYQAIEKRRIEMGDKLLGLSSAEIPEVLIESEARRIESQFTEDIRRMGVSVEDYLKHAKKTLEDLRQDWRPYALKKAKLQLILNEVAQINKIVVDKKKIEEEVVHILTHYKDASQESAYIYAETILMNEEVFKFLESQK
ncbi:MAG: trigger factor [Patescibacteria group bacterium]